MKSIIFEPRPELARKLNEHLDKRVREILTLRPPAPNAPATTPGKNTYLSWIHTPEGRVHAALLKQYVLPTHGLSAKRLNTIQQRLIHRGNESRGRPAMYDPKLRDLKFTRLLRVALLNELVAKGLGLDTSTWELPELPEPTVRKPEKLSAHDMLTRFERWADLHLPLEAWLLYTRAERRVLADKYPTVAREPDGGVSMTRYTTLIKQNNLEAA